MQQTVYFYGVMVSVDSTSTGDTFTESRLIIDTLAQVDHEDIYAGVQSAHDMWLYVRSSFAVAPDARKRARLKDDLTQDKIDYLNNLITERRYTLDFGPSWVSTSMDV
jgi:hypothetical protein